MPACAIRYRLDGPGPAAFLVDCDGEYHVYARGALGGAIPQSQLLGLLASRGCRWVPASGEIPLKGHGQTREPVRPATVDFAVSEASASMAWSAHQPDG